MLIADNMISTLCEVTTLNNFVLVKGKISKTTEEYIEITNPYQKMQTIQEDLLVKLIVYGKNLNTYIGSVCFSNDSCIRLINIKEYKSFEKRKSYRVELSVHSEGYPYMGGKKMLYDFFEPFDLTIMDLSLTGLLICTRRILAIDQRVGILIPLKNAVVFDCKVVRVFDNTYGCEFLEISSRQENLLSLYILKKQRELIKKNKILRF